MLDSFGSFKLLKALGQLVWARGAVTALNPFEASDRFVDIHALDERGDALEVSTAATDDFETGDDITFIGNAHEAGANVLRLEFESFGFHYS